MKPDNKSKYLGTANVIWELQIAQSTEILAHKRLEKRLFSKFWKFPRKITAMEFK